jgi:hypothetical protein
LIGGDNYCEKEHQGKKEPQIRRDDDVDAK